ncbi:MAG: D-alanyl-D-alanine carboxypeptidase [Chloroflexi bacterium]|nr:D-alanyl-D-alanine carboxypeptidase [Chloroflexota bacterium]
MRIDIRLALLGVALALVLLGLASYQGSASSQPSAPSAEPEATTAAVDVPIGPRHVYLATVARQAAVEAPALRAAPPARAPLRVADAAPPAITAREAVIVDEASGAVLWAQEAHRRVAVASLTKIVTALVALERGRLDARVPIDFDHRTLEDSTVMGLLPGELFTLEDLLYGLMLPSGNDAAIQIARHIAGSEEAFAELMNAKAAELGLVNSRFVNAHGLDEPGHYSSAYDMAMLAREGMLRDETFRKLTRTKVWAAQGRRGPYEMWNLNRLLYGQYDGADGVKIGYTEEAGRTMVASATRGGRRVYAAFMHSQNLVADARALLDYAFDNFVWQD